MQLEKVKDPRTGSIVKVKDGEFNLFEGTISHDEAVEKFNNGEIVAYLDESNESEEENYETVEMGLEENVKNALSEAGNLSEEAKEKMATIFESAVNEKVNEKISEIQEDYNQKLEEKENKLIENVDDYLSYAVKEWKKENEIALQEGTKVELTSNVLKDIKNVFESYNIEIPEEKVDQIESLNSKIAKLETKLDEQYEENKRLQEKISESEKDDIIEKVGSNLTATDYERFKNLVEDLDFTSTDRFKQKAETILETYFNKSEGSSETGSNSVNEESTATQEPERKTGSSLAEEAARFFTSTN